MKNRKIALLLVGVYALSLIASAITVQPVQAAVAAGYSEYFIPGSTDQLFRIIQDNDNVPQLGNAFGVGTCPNNTTECNEMHNVISVSVATDGLKLYYDHWENGYGTGSVGDEVFTANAGDVLVFESGDIRVPRVAANTCTSTNPSGASTRCYDGRDRVYVAGGAVSLAQAFWPEAQDLDTVYSNAWEVYPVKPYQSSYTMPVGEDLVSQGYTDFTHAYLIVQGTTDNTTVVIDDPQVAGVQRNVILNRGAVTEYFHFHTGTTINASAPVQVQFVIGNYWDSTSSDTRSYTAVPDGLWASSYYSPVPSYNTAEVDLYIYNPTAAPLSISYQDGTGSGTLTVPARSTRSYQALTGRYVPAGKGVMLEATDKITKFWAIGSYDTESAQYNYGFTLIPPEQLTNEYFISWAPGTTNDTNNGSPVFVTPVQDDTTVFVDHSPADGVVDATYTLDHVEIAKIRDLRAGDFDNTGMHIWATGPIAVVWGEDAQYAGTGTPYIDAGYTILPLKQEWMESVLTMDKSANPAAVSSEIGSTSEFTLLVQGYAYGLDGVWVFDDLPAGWSYVPGSTTITLPGGSTITGAGADPAVSGQELTWTKFPSAPLDMQPGEALKIVYQARVDVAPSNGYVINESTVTGTVGGDSFTASDATTVYMVDMNAAKTSSAGGVVNPGDTITYTVTVNNTGGSTLNDIVINDPLPAGTSYVPQSTKVSLATAPLIRTYRDEFNAVQYNNSNGTVSWSAYDWIETGSDSSGFPDSGSTLINGGYLRFNGSSSPSYLTRSVPMAGAISATLSFNYQRYGDTYGTGDVFAIDVINGGTHTRLDTFNGNLAASGTYSRDITTLAKAGTEIQLIVNGFTSGGSVSYERLEIDNVQVQYTLPGTTTSKDNIPGGAVPDLSSGSGVPPTMARTADNIDMPAGSTLTMTYQVRVDNPAAAGITNIVNTAEVRSAEMPDPLQALASDRLRGVHLVALKTAAPATVPETGGSVTFTYTVTNDGLDPVTINTLVDDRFGTLPGDADCKTGTVLAGGASCSFAAAFNIPAGNAGGMHQNIFSVTGSDGFGNTGGTSESETVSYTNVNPSVSVVKMANPTSLPETGGPVTYTFTITNTGLEAFTLGKIYDEPFAPMMAGIGLPGDADCKTETVLAAGASCSFDATFTLPPSNAGMTHVNTVQVLAWDNDGNGISAFDDATVIYTDALPAIAVTKEVDPTTQPEEGGPATFTYTVTNNSGEPVEITSLVDGVFGVLTGDADCQVGTILNSGQTCAFEATFPIPAGEAGETQVSDFTAQAEDNEGNSAEDTDDATVTYTDTLPAITVTKDVDLATLPEEGGPATFTYTVTNDSDEPVEITSLVDGVFGVLTGDADCAVGTVLVPGATCTFEATFPIPAGDAGDTHVSDFTANAEDNEGNTATDTDDAVVTYADTLPAISVSKEVDPVTLPEEGGPATFTYTVTNDSDEPVEITSLVDGVFGALTGDADCAVGTVLDPGEICSFEATFPIPAGDAGDTHVSDFTAQAEDNEGNPAADTDDASVTYTDTLPIITVTKDVDPVTLPEEGGPATFTYSVTNDSSEPVEITSLVDGVFGALTGDADCQVGTILNPGQTCTFEATFPIPAGEVGDTHVSDFTAQAEDNEDNTASATDDATVTYTDTLPAISVTKTADPAELLETGGSVAFTFVVENTGLETVSLTNLMDDMFGDLNGQGTCAVPQIIAAGGSYTCSVTQFLSSDTLVDHTNTVTATAEDNEGNPASDSDSAVVTFTNVAPTIAVTKTADQTELPETGGDVVFTFLVENTGTEDVTLTSLVDDVFGNLDGQGDCLVPQTIAVGGSYACSVTQFLSSDILADHTNTFTATVEDNDGSTDEESDSETVTFTDILPSLAVEKTAGVSEVAETGGDIVYTFTVTNNSTESVTITALEDVPFGSLAGDADCQLGTSLAAGESCSFGESFTLPAGTAGDTYVNTFTATVEDNDGSSDTETDDAAVQYADALPEIAVTKTASPDTLPETGGDVTFTFEVENSGLVPVTLTSLVDDVFGNLNGQGTCTVPQNIAVGGSYTCQYTVALASDTLADHVNTVTATASDIDGNTDTADDDATVTFNDVLPTLSALKTAGVSSVLETGGSVTFTYMVTNNSSEAVTIASLVDDQFGPLLGDADCKVGTVLPVGASCSFEANFTIPAGSPGGSHVNIFTVTADDNDGSTATVSDDETITYTEVLPEIAVTKTADQTTLPESGNSVTFTFVVENIGLEDVTLTSLVDDVFGDLDGQSTCAVPQAIAAGNSYTCQYTTIITSDSLADHVNTVTAIAEDNDGNDDSANDSETITFTDEAPSYTVTKTASLPSLPETGGSVTFTFMVENTGNEALTLSSMMDSVYGNLNGQGTCSVPQTIAVGSSYSCAVTKFLSSGTLEEHTNTITATVGDNDGNTTTGTDGETVTFTDELPLISVTKDVDPTTLPEEGGPATFTYTVTNDSDEPVEITSLVDGVFGVLTGDADCAVSTVLVPGATCTFEATFPIPAGDAGDTHVSDFTANAEDNEGNTATDTDDAVVTYTDTLPAISVTKAADQAELPETGSTVTFTFLVENTGSEAVTLSSLVDDVLGDLNGQGTCAMPQINAVGGSYTCQLTTTITGDSLADHVNTVTAIAEDNDGSTATDSDSETITFTDVQPAVTITKTANPTSVPETGGAVAFTFVVENTGQEAATLTSLVDDVFGNLNGQGTCTVPQTIAAGGSYTCSITRMLTGDTTANHANTVTAAFGDNDGNTSTTSDGAVVSFTNVAPEITVLKTAGASDVPETGGSVTYTYTVTNTGLEPVTIGSLSDDKFGVLTGDADCQVNTVLAGGESCEFDAAFTLPASDRGETHTNIFTAVASDNEGGSDTATDDATVTYTDVAPQISVLKTASVNEIAETGGDVTFTYTVTNLSAEPAMIALLWDDPFGELDGDADCNSTTTLADGATCSFEATFTIPAGEPGGVHVDTFTASVMDDEENFAEASDDETVTYTNVLPDITVTKTAAVSTVVETGENITFTFTVTNNSLEDATITALTDDKFGPLDGSADCQVGTVLVGGAFCSFDAVLAIPTGAVGSTHVNTFTAAVEDNDGSTDNASESETITYTAAPAPAITVLKEVFAEGGWWDANTAPGPEIRYGQAPQFRFTVRNTGNIVLTGITLSDSMYSTDSCTIPAGLSPNDGVDGSGMDEFSCTITAAWALGQHTNTATASASYGATPVSASDDANYVGVNNAADLAVTKTDGVATYTPGRQLTYTIVVTNNGPDPVTGAVFTDTIPAQIARWTWTCAHAGGASGCAGVTNSAANFTNTIDLPVSGSITYTVNATTRSSATTALTNTALVSTPAGTDDTNPGNNSASDVDTAAPRVDISLNKAVDAQFRAGENLSYTLTVTNNGPSDATNVVLSDVLPNEVTFVSATPAITSGPNPVKWNLGTLASGATRTIRLVVRVKEWVNQPFTNTASVTSATPESSVTDNSDDAVADPQEPTPVTLLYFRAAPADGLNVLVEWKAETEVDHFAYKLYRSTAPVFEEAEELTIVEPNAEKTYSYNDTVPAIGNYYYWLVDISMTNAVEVHEPVLVIFNALRFYLPVVGR